MLTRERALEALVAERFDVVVIGGGITGAGVALDAASRGYSVALVEKADFASGTSSRSSKLVHGGLRYLQNFDLGLVREALLERQLMVNLAPHLVKPLPMVVPAFDGARPDRLVGIGLNMYDVMATPRLRGRRSQRRAERAAADGQEVDWSPERHRVIDGEEVAALVPALRGRNPTGAYLFYDCQTDDSRLVLTVLAEAERFGAICANRLEVIELESDDGRGTGVTVLDAETGGELVVRADNVVNATGVWADRIRPEELHSEAEVPTIAPSRGTHITIDSKVLPMTAGAIVPAGEGRSIFALPWLGRTLVGTTDNNYDGNIDHVKPSEEDIAYLLDAINAVLRHRSRDRPDHRRVRRRAAIDLERRHPEVGRHLPQGGAVRDLERDDHDHRRQADDLAADGQDGRRPPGRARRAPGSLPDARDPARSIDRSGRPAAGGGGPGRVLCGACRPLRARG